MDRAPFFSIVVPAHNESQYIAATIDRLLALDYPSTHYEIIVVENGSTDDTLEKIRSYESKGVTALVSEKGVCRARNAGARVVRPEADWVVFLDADILLDSGFLARLAAFLESRTQKGKAYVGGTASLMPFPQTVPMSIMYAVANVTFFFTGATYAGAFFMKREYLTKVTFDEFLQVGEEQSLSKELRTHGKLCFLWSTMVHSSTRRFQNGEAQKIPIWVGMWLFAMIAPYHARITTSIQRRFRYKAIR